MLIHGGMRFQRYLTGAGSTLNAQALTNGLNTNITTANQKIVWLDDSPDRPYLGATIKLFGTGDNNGAFTGYLWEVYRVSENQNCGILQCVGNITSGTLSAEVGVNGQIVEASERFADAFTWTKSTTSTTPRGPMTVQEVAYNENATFAAAAYSPSNDVSASLLVPSFGDAQGFLLELVIGANTTAMNAIISLHR